jgi:hypothetical protein
MSHYHGVQFAAHPRFQSTDAIHEATGAITMDRSRTATTWLAAGGVDWRRRQHLSNTCELPFHGNQWKGWDHRRDSGRPGPLNSHQHQHVHRHRSDQLSAASVVGDVNQWFANSVCDPRISGSCASSSLFALPVSSAGVFPCGRLPRNAIIGPGFRNVDM